MAKRNANPRMETEASTKIDEAGMHLNGFQWTENGYLVDKSSNEEEPLLLEPVQEFLRLLHPDSIADATVEPTTEQNRDEDQRPAENSSSESSPDTTPTPPEFCNLVRVPHLFDRTLTVITCIDNMKEFTTDKSAAYKKKNWTKSKVDALEKQQQARLLKKQSSVESNSGEAVEEEDGNDALLQWVRTMNSIRCVFPLILDMVNHERRNDEELCIQSVSIKPGKKIKARNFLLFQHVFGVASPRSLQTIKKKTRQVLCCLCRSEAQLDAAMKNQVDWNTLLPACADTYQDDELACLLLDESKINRDTTITCNELFVAPFKQGSSLKNEAYEGAIISLRDSLERAIRDRFRGARLTVYGSCLSGLSLGKSSDVDMSLHLPAALYAKRDFEEGRLTASRYEQTIKKLVYRVSDVIRHIRGIHSIQPVVRARVPVIKGTDYEARNPYAPDGSLSFDICFLNDIAVANSSLLREYSLVDERVKLLMLMVKKWTQHHRINNAAENTLSSYAWINLVVFYVQCIGLVPNLQCPDFMGKHGLVWNPQNSSHCINDLNTAFLTWDKVKRGPHWSTPSKLKNVSVTSLLYGFFRFYASSFPLEIYAVSIRRGTVRGLLKSSHKKARVSHLCIEDPFETFDSHCPHDLACPCVEGGQPKIRGLIIHAEKQLGSILKQQVGDEVSWIWPAENGKDTYTTSQTKQAKKQPKKPKGQASKKNQQNGSKQPATPSTKQPKKRQQKGKDQAPNKVQQTGSNPSQNGHIGKSANRSRGQDKNRRKNPDRKARPKGKGSRIKSLEKMKVSAVDPKKEDDGGVIPMEIG